MHESLSQFLERYDRLREASENANADQVLYSTLSSNRSSKERMPIVKHIKARSDFLGMSVLRQVQAEEAPDSLQHALAYYNALRLSKQIEKAENTLKGIIRQFSEAKHRVALINNLRKNDDISGNLILLASKLDGDNGNLQDWFALYDAQRNEGLHNEADTTLSLALKRFADKKSRANIATRIAKKQDLRGNVIARAIQRDENQSDISAHLALYRAQNEAGVPRDADETLIAAIQVFSEQKHMLNRLGVIVAQHGRAQVLPVLKRVQLSDDPANPMRHIQLIESLQSAGEESEARAQIEIMKKGLISSTINPTRSTSHNYSIEWVKKSQNGWLTEFFGDKANYSNSNSISTLIEYICRSTNKIGSKKVWSGYGEAEESRIPNEVRIGAGIGDLFTNIVKKLKPDIIVEVGTAFGVSGMYFSAGLELNGSGVFYTFDPNTIWQSIGAQNIANISSRFLATNDQVELCDIGQILKSRPIDLLFIDAIHTREAVSGQLSCLTPHLATEALVMIDDINFSANMRAYWDQIAAATDVLSSLTVNNRIGMMQIKGHE